MNSTNLFKNRNFLLIILAQLLSSFGSKLQSAVFSLEVLNETGSAQQFSFVLVISVLPAIIFGPFCGVIVDWFNKKKLVLIIDTICFVFLLLATVDSIFNGFNLTYIYIIVFVLSTLSALYNPAINTIFISIVNKEQLVQANSISDGLIALSTLIAPSIGAVLYTMYGLNLVMIINSISFLIAVVLQYMLILPKCDLETKKPTNILFSFKQDLIEGFKYIFNKKVLFRIIICIFIINFFLNGTNSVGSSYICKEILKASDIQYGFMMTAISIGEIIGFILAGIIASKIKLTKLFSYGLILVGFFVFGIGIISMQTVLNMFETNAQPYVMFILMIIIESVLIAVINAVMMTLMQQEIENEYMGRVHSLATTIGLASVPLGQLVYGYILEINTFVSYTITAVVLIITSVIFSMSLKGISDENLDVQLNE